MIAEFNSENSNKLVAINSVPLLGFYPDFKKHTHWTAQRKEVHESKPRLLSLECPLWYRRYGLIQG